MFELSERGYSLQLIEIMGLIEFSYEISTATLNGWRVTPFGQFFFNENYQCIVLPQTKLEQFVQLIDQLRVQLFFDKISIQDVEYKIKFSLSNLFELHISVLDFNFPVNLVYQVETEPKQYRFEQMTSLIDLNSELTQLKSCLDYIINNGNDLVHSIDALVNNIKYGQEKFISEDHYAQKRGLLKKAFKNGEISQAEYITQVDEIKLSRHQRLNVKTKLIAEFHDLYAHKWGNAVGRFFKEFLIMRFPQHP